MLEARFRPLEKWPDKPRLTRIKSPFSVKYTKALDILERELRHLRAKDVVIEAGFTLQDIRNDGWPRSGTSPRYHQGVILYFTGTSGAMRMPSGRYASWQTNLYAIALTLERLRAIDRYGVTMGHEQYQGFRALPPSPTQHAGWTLDEAAVWLAARTTWAANAKQMLTDYDAYRRAYREAAAKLHPDQGGSVDLFHALQTVADLLNEHHRQSRPFESRGKSA